MPKLKFLIVEDDLFYQTYVNDLLAETGVDIINAVDGEAGLTIAVSEHPDLIITDIEIPKIQGFVFFKKLRENPETKDIPVIMMSGKVEKALLNRHSGLNVHAEGYLVKPFSGQVLIEKIREVIGEDFGYSEIVISPELDGQEAPVVDDRALTEPEITEYTGNKPAVDGETKILTSLVVDDSRYICDISRDFLEEIGMKVEVASDGETGYQMACDLLPDIVLLDVQMPNMNGFVVCEMLRKNEATKNIPIILMSAVVDDDSFKRHSKLRYHADAYLQKPFKKSELHELIRRFTSLGDAGLADLESKTGFFVPTEESDLPEKTNGAVASGDPKLLAELKQAKLELQQRAERESQLEEDVQKINTVKDQLEAELFELKKTVEGKESGIEDKLTLATQKFEEARAESQKLSEENLKLKEKLDELSAAQKEQDDYSQLEEQLRQVREDLNIKISENNALSKKIEEAGSAQELKAQITDLVARLQEATASALELENRKTLLEEENARLRAIADAGSSAVQGGEDVEELKQKIESMQRDLTAAIAAKKEIEDQAKSLLEKGDKEDAADHYMQEFEKVRDEKRELEARLLTAGEKIKLLDDLQSKLEIERSESDELRRKLEAATVSEDEEAGAIKESLSAAIAKAEGLEEENRRLAQSLQEAEETTAENSRHKEQIEELEKDLGESRKLAADQTQARMDLEGTLDTLSQEKKLLKNELDEARRQLDEQDRTDDRITELEEMLQAETDLREDGERELEKLRDELVGATSTAEKVSQLQKENQELNSALAEARSHLEHLEKKTLEGKPDHRDEEAYSGTYETQWDDRFNRLEDTLGKTVKEAQMILKQQKDRESVLEEKVESLVRSLEEERETYRRERTLWSEKENELRDAFEDALKESRRLMGEEAARLYPMQIPRRSRPLEVVSRQSKYGIIAAAVLAGIVLFSGGYMIKSGKVSSQIQATEQIQSQVTVPVNKATPDKPPEPWIARSSPEMNYEELWRRNTVQSVSDDMMIQATLHTRDELEAAIKYTAEREGWTRERIQKAMADISRTYNLSGSYYITVYSKNLKSGYPGYADSFEQHIALRDQSGREVRAHFPGELEGSKFITSRVSAAGKEMNPVFLYEVGLTVAFARDGLMEKPEGLQLVLYDIGAVPMRVLTWDMSGIGSLS